MAIYSNNVSIANDGELIGGGVDWQSVKTASFTAVAGEGYFIDTTSGAVTATLPASPSLGDTVSIVMIAGTNAITVARNGSNIDGSAADQSLTVDGDTRQYVYVNASEGWKKVSTIGVQAEFISATGGTVTESGDYRIHTFTGDGCFSVSSLGNGPTVPIGGPNTVSYLVVAGGGGGASAHGGGGGAGGFREGKCTSDPYSASPLNAPDGLTITATTYPVTVGGGAPSTYYPCATPAPRGSDSIFATITAGGGGSIPRYNTPGPVATPTISGGSGAAAVEGATAGSGNTPPVSPPQGNPGGGTTTFSSPNYGSGGGGGAGEAGKCHPGGSRSGGGDGGNGATTSITGSSTTYAGGGGGAVHNNPNANAGSGGTGGGGDGAGNSPVTGQSGTANTGGGGGGGGSPGPNPERRGGGGGKGIVVIRYKYQ